MCGHFTLVEAAAPVWWVDARLCLLLLCYGEAARF